jgi:superfamily I DNA/RNA helicase
MNPLFTEYHTAIWNFLKTQSGNLIINAGPGSGKTWSVKNLIVPALISTGLTTGGCIAFNTKNANDLKAAITNPNVICSTVHSALFACYRKNYYKVRVEVEKAAGFDKWKKCYMPGTTDKCKNIADILFPDAKESPKTAAVRLVSLMKMNALGLPGYPEYTDRKIISEIMDRHSINNNNADDDESEDVVEMAIEIFRQSIRATGTINHDDMIYMTLFLNAPLPDWDFLVYDEGQDMKPADLEFLVRMKKKGCRIAIVGDTKQGINFFTGSMQGALEVATEKLEASMFPLPVSYRCSKAAAAAANEVFPDSVIAGPNAKDGLSLIHI